MDSGLGPTLTLIVAGVLWLVYLAPSLRRKREFDATEKNAIRIQQALRAIAQTTETPDEIVTELSNRDALLRQRERERLEREHERELRAQVRGQSTIPAAWNSRSLKLGISALGFGGLISTGVFGFAGAWVATVVSLAIVGIAGVALVLLNGAGSQQSVQSVPRYTGLPEVDDTWTPIRTPKVHRSIPEGAGLIVTPETVQKVDGEDRAARIREQAAREAKTMRPVVDPRFADLGVVADDTPAVDINAALRARRAQ